MRTVNGRDRVELHAAELLHRGNDVCRPGRPRAGGEALVCDNVAP
jgi:hypothetical protein